MTEVLISKSSLISVITMGLPLATHSTLSASEIESLSEFILNYYTPADAETLAVQFIGETRDYRRRT